MIRRRWFIQATPEAFDELKDNERTFLNRDPLGDFYDKEEMVYPSHARSF